MFKTLLAKYERETGDIMSEEKKQDLARLARLESSFNSNATNKASSAAGYFQLIRSNRKGMSDQQFLKDTNAQFAAASILYDSNYKALSKYSDNNQLTRFQKVYGFWFNPKATEQYLLGQNVQFKDGLGTSLQEIFKRAKQVS